MEEIVGIILRVGIVAGLIELACSPRLDYTHRGQLLLWYGIKVRKSYLIYDNN
jgi:hypothetical protein